MNQLDLWPYRVQRLLVVFPECDQPVQRLGRELQQWQRGRRQQDGRRLRPGSARRPVILLRQGFAGQVTPPPRLQSTGYSFAEAAEHKLIIRSFETLIIRLGGGSAPPRHDFR